MKTFLLILLLSPVFKHSPFYNRIQEFDKTDFYRVLKSGTSSEINKELSEIDASSLKDKEAFTGALLMKMAGLLKVPKEKMDNFKKGATKLETVIQADSSNVEYRFLRLIIQEHAPKVVKYNKNISGDAAFIKKNYKELSPDVQKILIDYSQTSKALKPEDFQS
jgi:hypothetical protein